MFHNFEVFAAKTSNLDVQIIVDELQLLAERHKRFVLAQQPAQNVAELQHDLTRRVRVKTDQRRHGVQRVKEKMRINLP